MNQKHFLDYLCSIGLGRKDTQMVRTSHPNYPNNKSIYVLRGTTFYTAQNHYTIEIPLAIQDNTHVETNISLPGSQVTQSPAFWKKLLFFLEDLAHSSHVYRQRYGVTFYGGRGGWDYSKYRANKRDALNISPLSAVTSVAMPHQVGKDPLNFATALNYIKDIILSLEVNKTNSNRGTAISNKVEKKENRLKIDTISREKQTFRIVDKPDIIIEHFIAPDSSWHASGDRDGRYLYNRGDTVSETTIENWGGNYVHIKLYYPARDTIYEKGNNE
ncbi:MAG: hypothetical protein E6772_08495 [Dysgonomonas sp.]|nr:hypothetical protein [Dysgonomonas sp.]